MAFKDRSPSSPFSHRDLCVWSVLLLLLVLALVKERERKRERTLEIVAGKFETDW